MGDGYEFFASRQMVTLFSAPNYCGEFDNAGAMMTVRDDLMCSFQLLKPSGKKLGSFRLRVVHADGSVAERRCTASNFIFSSFPGLTDFTHGLDRLDSPSPSSVDLFFVQRAALPLFCVTARSAVGVVSRLQLRVSRLSDR